MGPLGPMGPIGGSMGPIGGSMGPLGPRFGSGWEPKMNSGVRIWKFIVFDKTKKMRDVILSRMT